MSRIAPPPRGNPTAEFLRRRKVLALVSARLQQLMAANESAMRGRGRDPFSDEPTHPSLPPERVPLPFGGPSRPALPPERFVPDPFGGPSAPAGPGTFDPGPRGPALPPFDFPRGPALPPRGGRPPFVEEDGSILLPGGLVFDPELQGVRRVGDPTNLLYY